MQLFGMGMTLRSSQVLSLKSVVTTSVSPSQWLIESPSISVHRDHILGMLVPIRQISHIRIVLKQDDHPPRRLKDFGKGGG
jgi:hypothetical protein